MDAIWISVTMLVFLPIERNLDRHRHRMEIVTAEDVDASFNHVGDARRPD